MRDVQVGDCRVEVLTRGDDYLGLGQIEIRGTKVRSGRLPLRVYTQTFHDGLELARLQLRDIDCRNGEARIRLTVFFRPLPVKIMRDHSFDPIHDTADWDESRDVAGGSLEVVLRPASDQFNGISFGGFTYHYEYASDRIPLFYLLDQASWELDGDIEGATVFNQSACSDPVITFARDTFWTTEGELFFLDPASHFNRTMTHNLPRWASHQAFDYQFKHGRTLLGVYERVDLIRSLLRREPGKPELKTWDKHIFDQSLSYRTSAKAILLNRSPLRTLNQQRNCWSWVFEDTNDRARAEFGLRQEPMLPRLCQNYWRDFTIDSYSRDLLPAAVNCGFRQLFVDNLNKSAMSEGVAGLAGGNMCCGHEYELAPSLGGASKLKKFLQDCHQHRIQVVSWTNNSQAYTSPLNQAERDGRNWFVHMEDTRLKYGGAYTNVISILDFSKDDARRCWVEGLKKSRQEAGLSGYLFDSFYNLGFMPISYTGGKPHTMWRQLLEAFKELQDTGIHFLIESFGPFGQPQHGHPVSYNPDNLFICYRIGLGDGYSTIPVSGGPQAASSNSHEMLYCTLAHMACGGFPLFIDGKRIDELWTRAHKQALSDYHRSAESMHRRYLQEDGKSVLWHNQEKSQAILWSFADRRAELPGTIVDLTEGRTMAPGRPQRLQAWHTYAITAETLPTMVCDADARAKERAAGTRPHHAAL